MIWNIVLYVAQAIGLIALGICAGVTLLWLLNKLVTTARRWKIRREQRRLSRTLVQLELMGWTRGFSPAPHEPHARIADNGRAYLEEES